MHARNCYPFKRSKTVSNTDVDLEDNTQDEEYLAVLAEHLDRIFDEVKPQLVYYQAGVDGLAGDRFGRLALTREGLQRRNRMVMQKTLDFKLGGSARNNSETTTPGLVITMGGGYGKDIQRTVQAHADVYWDAAKFLHERKQQKLSTCQRK
eukprot:GEZU01024616.1.p1 GENE.GEZU01024616.1~~GEZU01024616.1.p1  ORF type:complete len:151 (-),score=14.15 GEZU01024616.1:8-460(-)